MMIAAVMMVTSDFLDLDTILIPRLIVSSLLSLFRAICSILGRSRLDLDPEALMLSDRATMENLGNRLPPKNLEIVEPLLLPQNRDLIDWLIQILGQGPTERQANLIKEFGANKGSLAQQRRGSWEQNTKKSQAQATIRQMLTNV